MVMILYDDSHALSGVVWEIRSLEFIILDLVNQS